MLVQDGHFNYPTDSTDFKHLLELRAEAEYFGLVKLLDAIDAFPVCQGAVTSQEYWRSWRVIACSVAVLCCHWQ